jgi:hypothetical protein
MLEQKVSASGWIPDSALTAIGRQAYDEVLGHLRSKYTARQDLAHMLRNASSRSGLRISDKLAFNMIDLSALRRERQAPPPSTLSPERCFWPLVVPIAPRSSRHDNISSTTGRAMTNQPNIAVVA